MEASWSSLGLAGLLRGVQAGKRPLREGEGFRSVPYGVPPCYEARRNEDAARASAAACEGRGGALDSEQDAVPAGLLRGWSTALRDGDGFKLRRSSQ